LPDERLIVGEVAAAVGLVEGERGVRAVLAALSRLEPVSIRRLSRAVDLPVPIVAAVCAELRKRRVVAEQRPARLTPTGRRLPSAQGLRLGRGTCPACGGRGLVTEALSSLARGLDRAARGGPPARAELDQCHCTVETKLRRVLMLHEADALVGRRILLLGDDDLTALALRAVVRRFGSTSTVARLTVVDVDAELITFLRRALDGAPFQVECVHHDLRRPLPAGLVRAFDTVVTDPPYTEAGARLFLSRAAEALDGDGDVFLSFGSKRPDAALQVQHVVWELGFVIKRLVRDFNEYVGAGVLGGASHLYHLGATRHLRPPHGGAFSGPLYTADILGAPAAVGSRP
jgi:predicted methyltransferase